MIAEVSSLPDWQVLVTLEWLVASDIQDCQPCRRLNQSEVKLAKALWQLLHQLVIHHMEDLSLDVMHVSSAILLCATPSLEQPGLQGFPPFTQLVTTVLRRIPRDKALYEHESETEQVAGEKFFLLFGFLGTSCQKLCDLLQYHVKVLLVYHRG